MKIIKILFFCMITASYAFAQKNHLNTQAFDSWEHIDGDKYEISNNGSFVFYEYRNQSHGPASNGLVIKDKSGKDVGKIVANRFVSGSANFTDDSSSIIYRLQNDTIVIFNLVTRRVVDKIKAATYLLKGRAHKQVLVYLIGTNLFVRNLHTGNYRKYPNVKLFDVGNTGNTIITSRGTQLFLSDFHSGLEKVIFNGSDISNITWSRSQSKFAFVSGEGANANLHLFNISSENTVTMYESNASANRFKIASDPFLAFNRSEEGLFCKFEEKLPPKEPKNIITDKLVLWQYGQKYLRGADFYVLEKTSKPGSPLLAFIGIKNKTFTLVEAPDSVLVSELDNNTVLLKTPNNSSDQLYLKTPVTYEILDLKTGNRNQLLKTTSGQLGVVMRVSPKGRYVMWTDTLNKKMFCYDVNNRNSYCFSDNLDYVPQVASSTFEFNGFNIEGWSENDECFLANDNNDIWQFDPLGTNKPINLTNGYGRKNGLHFRVAQDISGKPYQILKKGLLIAALVDSTKYNGFYNITPGKPRNPIEVIQPGPFLYHFPGIFVLDPKAPVKARYANVFLMQRQSAKESPNLMILEGKKHEIITNIHPENRYNWLTSELHTWTMENGGKMTGILYKPENFDPSKMYPVIFHVYEMKSGELYKYRIPDYSAGVLDIPTYVSNGYLVFLPDLPRVIGKPGTDALYRVESAVKHLTEFSFIDAKRLGIQGHSFGGFRTNFIAATSKSFAAAQSSAGPSDLMRMYGEQAFRGQSLADFCEIGQPRMGANMWDGKDIYTQNSPIYYANKMTTPILMAHGINDGAVNFSQSSSFFLLLRRLQKPGWLLAYKGVDHNIRGDMGNVEKDFEIRQRQFFDHYLMNKPAPVWMTRGIQFYESRTENGLSIDSK